MHANDANKIIYKELSYRITGILFNVHNELNRYAREKQYGDLLESKLREENINYEREKRLVVDGIANDQTNKADFVIEGKILLELKAKPMITKEDYNQTQRYLQVGKYKLGLIVNFRNRYLKPIRIIRIDS